MKNRHKVLLLQAEFSPYRLPLYESLAKDIDLDVWACTVKSSRRLWSLPLENYQFKRRFVKSFNIGPFVISPFLLLRLIRAKASYDVYILGEDHRIFFPIITLLFAAKLFRRPVILWNGLLEKNYYEKYKNLVDKYLLGPISKILYRFTDAFIAYGESTKETLLAKGISSNKIFTGTQALCPKQVKARFRDNSRSIDEALFSGKKIILCVSYFDHRKGIEYLIKAYKQLNRNDTVMILAGSGREEKEIKSLASEADDIIFPGYVEGEKKYYYYSLADIFILPTLSDAWGLVVNEAMMFGLPIITTSEAGCAKELVKGNGFIVKPSDSSALKNAMDKILNDHELRKKMGLRSKELIEKYSIENAKKTFMNAIEHVMRT